jgi:hypothetical protein
MPQTIDKPSGVKIMMKNNEIDPYFFILLIKAPLEHLINSTRISSPETETPITHNSEVLLRGLR